MRSQYPWDLGRLGIEASLRTLLRRVLPPLTIARCRLVEVPKTVTRESLGIVSFRSSSRFPLSSGASVDNPVMFPPGRARLATNPSQQDRDRFAMTMGIVSSLPWLAWVDVGPAVTMTSTLRRTSSAASARRRSGFPSAHRHSMTTFFPSTYPSSRRPCRNASVPRRDQRKGSRT